MVGWERIFKFSTAANIEVHIHLVRKKNEKYSKQTVEIDF